ncbi:MAG: phosphomannomutase/phosphoglucomutase [Acidimicrobiia bacterium]
MSSFDEVVKAYDIRGTVPDQLNAPMCRALGAAFARFTKAPRVLIARDMRPSGEELSAAFAEGVRSQGVDVIHLGLTSTDMMYFATGKLDAPGAMFTASHNPAQYNGIKMCHAGAKPIGEESGLQEIKAIAENEFAITNIPAGVSPGSESHVDLLDAFADHVVSFIDLSKLKPLKVVADTANGMGGLIVPKVFERLPFDLEVMYGELDGTFPNHPADPIQPENQRDLQARVSAVKADIGLAFDGDADRVFVVDENGRGLSGSTTTAMLATSILARNPGATILHNLICSKAVPEVIRENGGRPVRTRVGHSFIKAVMAETGAAFGGEHSAHYYFRDNYRADSGIIASMLVLEQICASGQPLSELRKPIERYADSGEINTKVADTGVVIERVAGEFKAFAQDRLDGLTVDCGDWWFNLRPSNTEPLLRLNLEATTRDDCDSRVAQVLALIAG